MDAILGATGSKQYDGLSKIRSNDSANDLVYCGHKQPDAVRSRHGGARLVPRSCRRFEFKRPFHHHIRHSV